MAAWQHVHVAAASFPALAYAPSSARHLQHQQPGVALGVLIRALAAFLWLEVFVTSVVAVVTAAVGSDLGVYRVQLRQVRTSAGFLRRHSSTAAGLVGALVGSEPQVSQSVAHLQTIARRSHLVTSKASMRLGRMGRVCTQTNGSKWLQKCVSVETTSAQ